MCKRFLGMTVGLGIMALAAQAVQAQSARNRNCAPRELVMQQLAERFGETRRGIGLVQQGSVMELFASEATGSWTIVVTAPNGVTCLMAAGQAWEALAEPLPATDNDA